MRILQMLVFWLVGAGLCLAQTKPGRITLEGTYTFEGALQSLSKQARLDYTYNPEGFNKEAKVLMLQEVTAEAALIYLGKQYNFSYRKLKKNQVVLLPIRQAPSVRIKTRSQLRGRVRNPKGEPIVGAQVSLPQLKLQARSDMQGEFLLLIPSPDLRLNLVVKAEGYTVRQIPVRVQQNTWLDFEMAPIGNITASVGNSLRFDEVPKLQPLTETLVSTNPADTLPRDMMLYKVPFHFSFWPGVESSRLIPTAGSPSLALNLGVGAIGNLDGFGAGLLLNYVQYNVQGVQAAAFANVVRGQVTGLQTAGLYNFAGYSLKGVQAGGLINHAGANVDGGQFAGLTNYAGSGVSGIQAAGLVNVNYGYLSGGQFAGLINMNNQDGQGIQSAGLVNRLRGKLFGVQMAGLLNTAIGVTGMQIAGLLNLNRAHGEGGQVAGLANVTSDKMKGFQIGPYNYACKMEGFQLGVVNIADTMEGFALGLINLTASGRHEVELTINTNYLNSLYYVNGNRTYSWKYGLHLADKTDYPIKGPMVSAGAHFWPWRGDPDRQPYLPTFGLTAYQSLSGADNNLRALSSTEIGFKLKMIPKLYLGIMAQGWYVYGLKANAEHEKQEPNGGHKVYSDPHHLAWASAGVSLTYRFQ